MMQLFVILVVSTLFKETYCKCNYLHVVKCDNLEEAYTLKVDRGMTDFLIESKFPKSKKKMAPFNSEKFFKAFRLAKSVTIIGQINGREESFLDTDKEFVLDYIAFYGNHIKRFDAQYISQRLHLRRLSLVNNQIENIDETTFYQLHIEELDLSNNLLDSIECGCFDDRTKVLIIKNNKLSYIREKTLPINLEYLNLDNNQLVTIKEDAFDELVHLQELQITNNKLKIIPNLLKLNKLKILNLSYNHVRFVKETTFKENRQLKRVDLNHNNVGDLQFLTFIPPYTEVYLNFNTLRTVSVLNVNRTSLINLWLHPNPWWCSDWIDFHKFLLKNNVQLSNCDTLYFKLGQHPYCLDYNTDEYEDETENFFEIIESKRHLLECDFIVKVR